jgi:hypothetical protein
MVSAATVDFVRAMVASTATVVEAGSTVAVEVASTAVVADTAAAVTARLCGKVKKHGWQDTSASHFSASDFFL